MTRRSFRSVFFLATAFCAALLTVHAQPIAPPAQGCGEVVSLVTHKSTNTRYSLWLPERAPAQGNGVTLVMLIGGGGYMQLGDNGCPQLLRGNVLVRMRPLLAQAGIATVLVDAPSDMQSDEGLAGFRVTADHAEDVGKVIADVRARTHGAVWVVGHSRGSISAATAAARLTGAAAPDGVVLLSAIMVGDAKARKAWVAQTVLWADLDAIRMPLLLLGHVADSCVRSPAELMPTVLSKTHSTRSQIVNVSGGPIASGRAPSAAVCEVREPHDFVEQEAEVAAGIARFVNGGAY